MTKTEEYQNALNYITSEVFTGGNSILETEAEAIKKLLQPLIDKTKTPTLEEVKKEWEELGYKIHYWNNIFGVQLEKTIYKDNSAYAWHTIYIDVKTKEYYKHNIHLTYINFTFQEHQLLTKTFKALGWYDE